MYFTISQPQRKYFGSRKLFLLLFEDGHVADLFSELPCGVIFKGEDISR